MSEIENKGNVDATALFQKKLIENVAFQYVSMSKNLFLRSDLNLLEKHILSLICHFSYNTGNINQCYEGSNQYLALYFQVSESRISQVISQLEKLRLVDVECSRIQNDMGMWVSKRKTKPTALAKLLNSNDFIFLSVPIVDITMSLKNLTDSSENLTDSFKNCELLSIVISKLISNNSITKNSNTIRSEKSDQNPTQNKEVSKISNIDRVIDTYIKKWNDYIDSNIKNNKPSKIKIDNTSKIIKSITTSILMLENGTFLKNRPVDLDVEKNKKFTTDEIIKNIEKYLSLFDSNLVISGWKGVFNREKLLKSLDAFLYNPISKNSFFFFIFDKDIVDQSNLNIIYKDLDYTVIERYFALFKSDYIENYKVKILKTLNELNIEFDKIIQGNQDIIKIDKKLLFDKYLEFIFLKYDWIDSKNYGNIAVNSEAYRLFKVWLNENEHINIDMSETERLAVRKDRLIFEGVKTEFDFLGNLPIDPMPDLGDIVEEYLSSRLSFLKLGRAYIGISSKLAVIECFLTHSDMDVKKKICLDLYRAGLFGCEKYYGKVVSEFDLSSLFLDDPYAIIDAAGKIKEIGIKCYNDDEVHFLKGVFLNSAFYYKLNDLFNSLLDRLHYAK